MIVITLSDCPPKIRGDLSKWLCEISTGVYVGNISARVRDLLWDRICENVKSGRVTMVYNAAGEQRMNFRVHNTSWTPVDYDGIRLMKHPLPKQMLQEADMEDAVLSHAASLSRMNAIRVSQQRKLKADCYVAVDVETTGLSLSDSEIIELAALLVEEGKVVGVYHSYISATTHVPEDVQQLTGLTPSILAEQGIPLREALQGLLDFIADHKMVSHNVAFDCGFIQAGCRKSGLRPPRNPCVDTLTMARRKIRGVTDYKLSTLICHLGLEELEAHRAENDCRMTVMLYEKLKEMQ